MTYALWIVQVLLALVFALAGGIKLVLPTDVLDALGLVLPGLFRIRPDLTPLAAIGLVAVMLGALMFMPPDSELVAVLLPIVLGVLAGFVALGRSRNVRLGGTPR